jgi:hypothetical protein
MYGISGSGRKRQRPLFLAELDSEKVQEHTATVNASEEKMLVRFRIADDPGSIGEASASSSSLISAR